MLAGTVSVTAFLQEIPMTNPTESQIKDRIAEFVQELDLLVRKSTLDALKSVLAGGGGEAPAPFRRGRPKGSGRGPGRPKGSGNVEDAAAKIVAHVKANDGQGISAIADATGVALPIAKKAAIKLLAEGALKKSGQKRGTVYHVGSGRAPAKARKVGKRRGRKAKRKAAARKPALRRKAKQVVVIPVRRRPAAAPKTAVRAGTDVPQALAMGVRSPGVASRS